MHCFDHTQTHTIFAFKFEFELKISVLAVEINQFGIIWFSVVYYDCKGYWNQTSHKHI